LSRSARHPSATELYADGVHAATRSYEIGDPGLTREIAKGIDLRYQYREDRWHFTGSAYFNRFDNYLYAAPTGALERGFPVYQYTHADADFWGVEAELCWKLLHRPGQRLELSLIGDHVEANLIDSHGELPRIPASRLGLALLYQANQWTLRSDFRHVFAVRSVAENEFPSEAYQIWNVYVSHAIPVRFGSLSVQLRLRNLLNDEIRPHTSFLKDLAPQPGRGAELSLRWQF
jgi:iron complex outermembrane receptor protein